MSAFLCDLSYFVNHWQSDSSFSAGCIHLKIYNQSIYYNYKRLFGSGFYVCTSWALHGGYTERVHWQSSVRKEVRTG